MDSALIKAIGLKALLVGVGALLLFWTFNAIKLVVSARGINPLVKKVFLVSDCSWPNRWGL